MNDTCNSDNKSDPPFYPINIPVLGRPKGTNKPLWEFSKSKCPLSLKKIKRKCEDNETSEKIQRTNDVITDCSESRFITKDNDNEFEADIITNNSWIKFDTVSLDVNSKALGSPVAQCLTRDREAAGSSLTSVTALWSLSKTHLS